MSATTLTPADPALFAQALVNFSANGQYPDNIDSLGSYLTPPALERALSELKEARSELEGEIRTISRTNAPNVDQWIQHAKTLRAEIDASRALGRSIRQSAERGDLFEQDIRDHKAQIAFLEREQIYNAQLNDALRGIRMVDLMLQKVAMFRGRNRIVDALRALAAAASAKRDIPALPSGRPLIMLEERYVKLQGDLHDSFIEQWKFLVNVDIENHSVTIRPENENDGGIELDFVFAAMEAFKETDKLMKELAEELKHAIFGPRFKLTHGELPLFEFDQNSVRLAGSHKNCDIKHVISDLEKLIIFLSSRLPPEIFQRLSITCATCISDHMRRTWLDVAVPVRLGEEMTEFRRTMGLILQLVETMDNLRWTGSKEFKEWVDGCAKIWLVKRKEHSLDLVRNQVSLGIGVCRQVERVEREVVKQGEIADGADWDANWDEDEKKPDEGDDFDAWGFGDDVTDVPSEVSQSPSKANAFPASAEDTEKVVTLTEKYTISSMPSHVITTITEIIEDALTLSDPENESNPITPAAAGLFAVPTLVLAMYRAVAPYFYKSHHTGGGKMFQYNDSMWLSSELQHVLEDWRRRPNISPRAFGKIKFDAEIETLQRWGKRAYAAELQEQKTILKDLMGGTDSFLDAGGREPNVSGGWGGFDDIAEVNPEGELEKTIDTVVANIRNVTTIWKRILSKSAWTQASAALLSVVARKIVADIQDRDSLGSDECERIAGLIEKVLRLDDLFIPENLDSEGSIYDPSFGEVLMKTVPSETNFPTPTKESTPSISPTRTSPITAEQISDFDSSAPFPAPDESTTLPSAFVFLQNKNLSRTQKEDLVHEKIGNGEFVPLTIAYAGTDWLRLQYTKEILGGGLKDIEFMWFDSELGLAFEGEEVVGWIERCFERSKKRGEVIGGIRRGRKAGV